MPAATSSQTPALLALEARAARDLAYVDFPHQQWVRPYEVEGGIARDVVIVGGGLSGLAIAFGLLREQINNIEVLDRSPEGLEGPWLTFARMRTLRTVKTLIGPDLGTPSLSFPSWYVATRGQTAWDALDLATNAEWMAYLVWFRRVAAIPVSNEVTLRSVHPEGALLRLQIERQGQTENIWTRRLVMAVGLSADLREIPAWVSQNLPAACWAHTADDIDFEALRGKRVAVLGAGASAFDNAAVALEHGAASVRLFARRARIEQPAIKAPLEFAGLYRYFRDLDDSQRWSIMRRLARHSTPPPAASVERCTRHPQFDIRTACAWNSVAVDVDGIRIDTALGVEHVDFIILGTGFSVSVEDRAELRNLEPAIARWRDIYEPPPDERPDIVQHLARAPYLGPAFEYQPKPGHTVPGLAHIYDFGLASLLSMGRVSLGMPGMKFGPTRLVQGITRSLFLEDAAWHESKLIAAEALAMSDTPEVGSVV